jgi:hypothetical protein
LKRVKLGDDGNILVTPHAHGVIFAEPALSILKDNKNVDEFSFITFSLRQTSENKIATLIDEPSGIRSHSNSI